MLFKLITLLCICVTFLQVLASHPNGLSDVARSPNVSGSHPAAGHIHRRPRRNNKPPSKPSPTHKGVIQVLTFPTLTSLGYVAADTDAFGEYIITPEINDALAVSFTTSANGIFYGPLEIATPGAPYPYFGAFTAYSNTGNKDDIGYGSSNAVIFGSTAATSPDASAKNGKNGFTDATGDKEDIESAIFYVDTLTGSIIPVWINSDGRVASSISVLTEDVLALVGDLNAFQKKEAPAQVVTFSFIPH